MKRQPVAASVSLNDSVTVNITQRLKSEKA